jgi:hypothetical protein
VSGADPVATRTGFANMLAYMLGNGARTIIVENSSRFARDLIVPGRLGLPSAQGKGN